MDVYHLHLRIVRRIYLYQSTTRKKRGYLVKCNLCIKQSLTLAAYRTSPDERRCASIRILAYACGLACSLWQSSGGFQQIDPTLRVLAYFFKEYKQSSSSLNIWIYAHVHIESPSSRCRRSVGRRKILGVCVCVCVCVNTYTYSAR